jgi:RimJ/RimL family protein N-acetyltransferase
MALRTVISTQRLLLRTFSLTDVPVLFALSREPGMQRFIPDQVYRDERHAEEVVRALMAFTAQAPDPRVRPYVLAVDDKETGSLIGHVGLSAARGSVEVGYAIAERLHGRGLATEAVSAASAWALGDLALSEVLGIVEADNIASCRVLEKAGFVRVRDEVKHAAGRTIPIVVYRRGG